MLYLLCFQCIFPKVGAALAAVACQDDCTCRQCNEEFSLYSRSHNQFDFSIGVSNKPLHLLVSLGGQGHAIPF